MPSTWRRTVFCRLVLELFAAAAVAAIPPATAFFAVTALRFYSCGLAVETAVSFVSAAASAVAAWGVRDALGGARRSASPGPAALGLVVAAVAAFALTRRTPEAPTLFALVGAAAALGVALDVAWCAREARAAGSPAPPAAGSPAPPTAATRARPAWAAIPAAPAAPAAPAVPARRARGGEDTPLLQGSLASQGADSEC